MNKILIIDDDIELCKLLQKCLTREGYSSDLVHTGTQGIKMVQINDYSLIILDVMLPEINGFSVLTEIRNTSTVPILMLTAKNSECDKINGLRLGADDYITKPFSINEFLARVVSLIRRYTTFNNSQEISIDLLEFKGLKIDLNNYEVLVNDKKIDLTAKEFDLLYFLASNQGKIFTKKQIYLQVWGDYYAFDNNNIMSFVSKLRKKIEIDSSNPTYIQTVWGIGYRFNQEV